VDYTPKRGPASRLARPVDGDEGCYISDVSLGERASGGCRAVMFLYVMGLGWAPVGPFRFVWSRFGWGRGRGGVWQRARHCLKATLGVVVMEGEGAAYYCGVYLCSIARVEMVSWFFWMGGC
jgi:hypothetical protein